MSDLIPIKVAEQACANLQAEIDRLKADLANCKAECDRLKADKERMIAQGDIMAKILKNERYTNAFLMWQATKEGKDL